MTSLLLAVVFVLIAVGVISIGWILTGKSGVRLGMCGRNPKEDCGKSISCSLCEKTDKKHDDLQKRGS